MGLYNNLTPETIVFQCLETFLDVLLFIGILCTA